VVKLGMLAERVTLHGKICTFHVLDKVVIMQDGQVLAIVNSYADEHSKELLWHDAYIIPPEAVADGVINEQTALAYLVSGVFDDASALEVK
jgi:hypothetical protein